MSYYNDKQRFNSPPMRFQGHNYQNHSTPKIHQNNQFHRGGSPYTRSPVFNNQPNMSFNSSPYHQMRNPSHSFNSAKSSPDQWSVNSNKSYSSNSSGSYFGDVSQLSPYNSPIRSNGSPYYSQNKNKRFQGKRNFQSPELNDSNPGHSHNIRDYVHPSMLEDPWKDLMAAMEKKA